MYLLELAVQGVKGCSPTTRAPLKPGYVLLSSPGPEPLPLGPLTTAILFSDGRGTDTVFLAPGAQSGKVAFALYGNDLVTYRVVRELGGAGVLSRLDKAAQRFETVTQDALEMGQFLRGQVGLPGKSTFEHLFTLSAHLFPSRNGKTPRAAESEPKKPLLQTTLPVTAATDVAVAEAKLEALQRELETSQEIDQLQFQQDGIASEMFELEAKLKSTEGLKVALAEAEAAWASAPTPESAGLVKDIVERAQRFPQLVQKRDDALARLAGEREAEAAAAAVSSGVEPLYRDPRFLAGAGIGLLCLVVGAFLRAGSGRYLALLDIPSFGFAALVALKWVDDRQSATKVGRKGGMIAAREKKIQDDFEAEAQHVRQAQKVLGVESAEEVVELLGRKALLAEKVQDLRRQLQQAEADPEFAGASREYERLRHESDSISQTMTEKSGGYIRDPREVERELERTRESIALALSSPSAAPETEAAPGAAASASGIVYEDPTPMLLSLASDLLQVDVPSVAALVKDRLTQYVAALCDRRYLAVELDHRGGARLTSAKGPVSASDLPPKDLDLYYLALRLTLAEKASAKAKIPLLIDDVLQPVVDDARLPLLGRMLKHLGTLTQVVHVTQHPTLAGMADASVNL